MAPNNVGISTFGDAAIDGVPIAGYIESFIEEELSEESYGVDEVPQKMISYFQSFSKTPNVGFHVGGYKREENGFEQHIWHVAIQDETVEKVNPPGKQGAHWNGVSDILARLLTPVGQLDEDGNLSHKLPHFQVPWGFFTLQDAIDFAVYAVQVTIDSLRFQPRPKTVGGPIDVLVIKPEEAEWIQKKDLHA